MDTEGSIYQLALISDSQARFLNQLLIVALFVLVLLFRQKQEPRLIFSAFLQILGKPFRALLKTTKAPHGRPFSLSQHEKTHFLPLFSVMVHLPKTAKGLIYAKNLFTCRCNRQFQPRVYQILGESRPYPANPFERFYLNEPGRVGDTDPRPV